MMNYINQLLHAFGIANNLLSPRKSTGFGLLGHRLRFVTALDVYTHPQYPTVKINMRAYGIVHKRCTNILRKILNPEFPVRRTSACLCVGWYNDRRCRGGSIMVSAAISVRVLSQQGTALVLLTELPCEKY
jgi:hypothetical protein